MKRLRTISALMLPLIVLGAPALHAETGQQVEINAATESARAELRSQMLAVYVAPGVLLSDVVSAGPIHLDTILAKAEPVGQPRWVGEDIVQVKLHLPAKELVAEVQAARKPLAKRMSESDFNRFKKEWINRSFQATGQAIPASRLRQVVTTLQPMAWAGIPDDARADAAARAHASAASSLVVQANAIRISPNQTVGTASSGPQGNTSLAVWADTLPATNIRLRDDRQVEVGLFVDKPGLRDVLHSSLPASAVAQTEDAVALNTGINGLPDVVVGTALATLSPTTQPQPALVIRQLPKWASDPIVSQGEAKFSTTQLRTARAAERSARETLRDKLQSLPIDDGVTLANAQPHAMVQSAIDEAVERARVSQVDYHADGSATVSVSLDPNDLLDALTGR